MAALLLVLSKVVAQRVGDVSGLGLHGAADWLEDTDTDIGKVVRNALDGDEISEATDAVAGALGVPIIGSGLAGCLKGFVTPATNCCRQTRAARTAPVLKLRVVWGSASRFELLFVCSVSGRASRVR